MIFVTVGTNEAPFDRLLEALPRRRGAELFVQHGPSRVRPPGARCVESLPYEDVLDAMHSADVVVTHAGVGSILTALAAGKRPVVMPRLRRYGEAVDDHQLAFARHLGPTGLVRVVEDASALEEELEDSDGRSVAVELGASAELVRELRDLLADVLGPPRYSR